MLVKMYGKPAGNAVPQERFCSPAVCTGPKKARIEGELELAHVGTLNARFDLPLQTVSGGSSLIAKSQSYTRASELADEAAY
ncbi:hypothetical protein MEA186_35679 [Mesorhizobium amorphae CCNWGS0123]|uniref:Uncharacterized protein n=1 Tax=Mesorhizobium amorphae CCNWGS0123 TaxID=1082933 RepID=G6YM96_9HYPH|nr:hypothetical protein [Mesorhizobium amorphae]ANT54438.1 hypothetical protein A6B35_30820 [Mesorhizobium amorphae CCNWGS0123]EHH02199.1 hypothetical protein MEA186_35679 [Mesorhizobium amorphae CCNWGS0123]